MRPVAENSDVDKKREPSRGLRQLTSGRYWIAILPAAALIVVGWFIPEYQPNEPIRLVSVRQLIDSSFPAPDWLQQAGYDEDRLTMGFKVLLMPLWIVTKNPIYVALAGRIVVWIFIFYALIRLVRAIGLRPYALAWGMVLWVGFGQTLGAHEWLFNGVEGKCLAYAALMLAVAAILRQRLMLAAFFCGVSWWFHVPVGAWGTFAVCAALVLCFKEYGFKRLLKFGCLAAVLLIPMAIVALHYIGYSGLFGANPLADWIVVVFRLPHHLDPYYFHGGTEFIELLVCAAVGVVSFYTITSRSKAGFLSAILGVLLLEFGVGLVARQFDLFWYLKMYPFRVADVLVLLLVCLALPASVASWFSRIWSGPRSAFVRKTSGIVALLAMTMLCLATHNPRDGRNNVALFTRSWIEYAKHIETPYHEMTHWIRFNTPKSAIIITEPCFEDFWIEAERAEVVNFKRVPQNVLAIEWYDRYLALNGGPFHNVGFSTCKEVRNNLPNLSIAQLEEIRRRYGGTYYLTTRARGDLSTQLAHENGSYYLYSLVSNQPSVDASASHLPRSSSIIRPSSRRMMRSM